MFTIECYFRSNPRRLRDQERMLGLWNSKGLFFITEQWLVDQTNNIHKKGQLNKIKLEDIKRKIELDNSYKNDTDPENVTSQETNTTTMFEEELSFEQINETPNANKNVWYTIKQPFNEEEEKLFERLVTLMGSKR